MARVSKKIEGRIARGRDNLYERANRRAVEDDGSRGGIGIRPALRLTLLVLALMLLVLVVVVSFFRLTRELLDRADAAMRDEANYLCLRLDAAERRAGGPEQLFAQLSATGEATEAYAPAYLLLADDPGDELAGLGSEPVATVIVASDDDVVASDGDLAVPGDSLVMCLGDEALSAVGRSIDQGRMQEVTLTGASFAGSRGFIMAGSAAGHTVIVFVSRSQVFKDRFETMVREIVVAVLYTAFTVIVVGRMLFHMVVRPVERANAALANIVEGDLDARVEVEGVREFRMLADGINVTVEALKGLIVEARTRMDAELATARAIQEGSLPRRLPPHADADRFDVFASMDAAREVGGDFYDFFLVGDAQGSYASRIALVVADVSDKGVPAALFMMRARALVRDAVQAGPDLACAVAVANAQLCDSNEVGMFVTAWVCVLDLESGRLEYVNAGHNPPILRQRNGDCLWLRKKSGPVLGLFQASFTSHSIVMRPHDMIVIYTDGVTESEDAAGSQYGEGRLLALCENTLELGPEAFARALRADVAAFSEGAEQTDDITILALRLRDADQGA